MYKFKQFHTTYSAMIVKKDAVSEPTSFGCCMDVSIIRTLAGSYDFIFRNRTEATLNGQPIENSADLMMLKLGDAIFPLNLRKSAGDQKLKIENIPAIIKRWDLCSQGYLSGVNAERIRKYIQISRNNLTNPENLLKSVLGNSVIQIITLIEPEKFGFKAHNLRHAGDIYNFSSDRITTRHTKDETLCIVENEEINASCLFLRGALIYFEGVFTLKVGNEYYIQEISIKSDAGNQRLIK